MKGSKVSRTVLDNGLTALIREMHHAPVATFWVFYRVGSRNELPGTTGISHWVEHMMFKGTPSFPSQTLDWAISRVGGHWNAFTTPDLTTFFETMPAKEIDLALRIESDRMVNSLFEVEQVESERTVIISERQGLENSPMFRLSEEVSAAAFRVHPYHHKVIGDMVDLEIISRDDLYTHYRRHYHPSNAIVVAAGDFDSDAMLDRISELFGPLEPGQAPPPLHRVEPEQRGERRLTVEGEGDTAYLIIAYRAPCATDPDFFPVAVLATALLGGGAGPLGDSGSNKSSRLYKALVHSKLAAAVSGGLTPSLDPTLLTISATVRAGRTPAEVEAALDTELGQLLGDRPLTDAELTKAIKRAKAAFAYSSESVTNQGFWLGFSELTAGSHLWLEEYLEKLQQVTLDDLSRAAANTFDRRRRTVGWYVPNHQEGQAV
jgi:zinc protease